MSAWLTPIQNALDAAAVPAAFFFRDDDVGWDNAGLFRLIRIFQERDTPIDLAVIPANLEADLARNLSALFRES